MAQPKRKPTSAAAGDLAAVRERIAETKASREAVAVAPRTVDEALASLDRAIAGELAAHASYHSAAASFVIPPEHPDPSLRLVPPELPLGTLLVWLAPDLVRERVAAEIRVRLAAQPAGLAATARAARLVALDASLLALERKEEAVIEAMEGEGLDVTRRPDADPRAVLGLPDGTCPRRRE